jgi:tryptophan synthase alpha chain
MSRLSARFAENRESGRKAFIPFLTAGDPDLATSLSICLKLVDLGADVIELGVPFSDPMADGPTIQRSSQRALKAHVNLHQVLDLAAAVRSASDVPLVLFSYLNPMLHMGFENFVPAAAGAGIDGVLFTDVVEHEAAAFAEVLATRDVDLISLIAPTTTDERLRLICSNARGFIYAVSRAGVTGASQTVSSEAEKLVGRARELTDLPIAVGFGISTAEQVLDVWRFADGAIVGSAIVGEIEKAQGRESAVTAVEVFVRGLLPKFANTGGEN